MMQREPLTRSDTAIDEKIGYREWEGGTMAGQLRLVSWNVCDGFRSKFGHLERLRPDVAILQEVRPDCLRYAALHENSHWIGDAGQKGMAIIGYNGWQLSPLAAVAERWFMPVLAEKHGAAVIIVAVWVDSLQECVPPTLRALEQLRPVIASRPAILAGDFNQSIALDRKRGPGRRFADVLRVMQELGLESAWHSSRQEEHGKETSATLYWQWNQAKPFHIDFAFASASLNVESATLGTFDQYVGGKISDHVPLVVDYAFV